MAELRRNPGPTGRPSTWSLLLLVVTPLVLLANSCTSVSSSRPGLTESGKLIDAIVSTLGESSLTLSFHETPSEIAVTNIYQSPDRLLTLERPDRRVIIGNNEYCSNTNGRNWGLKFIWGRQEQSPKCYRRRLGIDCEDRTCERTPRHLLCERDCRIRRSPRRVDSGRAGSGKGSSAGYDNGIFY